MNIQQAIQELPPKIRTQIELEQPLPAGTQPSVRIEWVVSHGFPGVTESTETIVRRICQLDENAFQPVSGHWDHREGWLLSLLDLVV